MASKHVIGIDENLERTVLDLWKVLPRGKYGWGDQPMEKREMLRQAFALLAKKYKCEVLSNGRLARNGKPIGELQEGEPSSSGVNPRGRGAGGNG